MNTFISRSVRERLELINQTAAKMDMAPAAIEIGFLGLLDASAFIPIPLA